MVAVLDNGPVIEDEDAVGARDGLEPVSDRDHRAARGQGGEGVREGRLGGWSVPVLSY